MRTHRDIASPLAWEQVPLLQRLVLQGSRCPQRAYSTVKSPKQITSQTEPKKGEVRIPPAREARAIEAAPVFWSWDSTRPV